MITTSPTQNFFSFFSFLVKNLFVLFKQHLFYQNVLTDFFLIFFFKAWTWFVDFQLLQGISLIIVTIFHSRSEPYQREHHYSVHDEHVTGSNNMLPDLHRESRSRNTPRTFYHNSAWFTSLKNAIFHILSQNLSSFSLKKLVNIAFLLKGFPAYMRISIQALFLHRYCCYQVSVTFSERELTYSRQQWMLFF